MIKEDIFKKIIFFFGMGLIAITLLNCSGEGDGSVEGNRPQSSEASRAISPQREYTKENPAEWETIANDHIPEIQFDEKKSKENLKVKIAGRKFSERHYIEVIGVMDERLADIDTKYLQRGDAPTVILSINPKNFDLEKLKVFAKCNLHDLWTVPLITKPQ